MSGRGSCSLRCAGATACAFTQLPALRAALATHYEKETLLPKRRRPLNIYHGSARFPKFNKGRGNPIRYFTLWVHNRAVGFVVERESNGVACPSASV
jgi:hypothetical protein